MRVVIFGGGGVQHSGKLYLPGQELECDDKDGNYLINAGVANLLTNSTADIEENTPENKTGGSKKGK